MPVDENTYRDLTPELKLKLFSSEARTCITSIVGYSQVLKLEVQKLELQDSLLSDFREYLEALDRISDRFVKFLMEINDPPENEWYSKAKPHEMVAMLLNDAYNPISAIKDYSALLEFEIQKPELQHHLASTIMSDVQGMQIAAERLYKTRQALLNSLDG